MAVSCRFFQREKDPINAWAENNPVPEEEDEEEAEEVDSEDDMVLAARKAAEMFDDEQKEMKKQLVRGRPSVSTAFPCVPSA